MRGAFAVLLVVAAVGRAQPPVPQLERYGVRAQAILYSQDTPKATVATLAALVERKKFDYIAAFVIDPDVVDARVNQRANDLIPDIEKQLDDLRAQQRLKPAGVDPEARIPDNAKKFADLARERANVVAFQAVVKELTAHLSEYPENLALFRAMAKEGAFADAGAESVVTLKGVADKKLFLKKGAAGWVVEDRQAEEKK